MESISSCVVKLVLRLMKYNKPYKTYDLDLERLREDSLSSPGKGMCKGCNVFNEEIGSNKIWSITPVNISNQKLVIYFHGGYIGGMVKEQWNTIAKIAVSTGSKVIIPDYPLAPESNYKDVFAMVSATYEKVLETTNAKNITFIGDSAGGGLLLSFAMLIRDEGKPLPTKLVALSPWVDVSMTNPEMVELEKLDPIIAILGLKRAGEMYAGGTDTKHYLVSPLYGEIKGLPPIYIFAGTHDILQPDEKIFAEKAKAARVETYYYEYPKMVHAWMFLPISEAKETIKKIVEII